MYCSPFVKIGLSWNYEYSGFMSKSRGSLLTPPGLGCTLIGGVGGHIPGLGAVKENRIHSGVTFSLCKDNGSTPSYPSPQGGGFPPQH